MLRRLIANTAKEDGQTLETLERKLTGFIRIQCNLNLFTLWPAGLEIILFMGRKLLLISSLLEGCQKYYWKITKDLHKHVTVS